MDALCAACSSIDLDAALCSPADGGAAHHSSFTAIKSSAAAGCPLCAGIVRRFWDTHPDDAKPDCSSPVVCNVWDWSEDEVSSRRGCAVIVFSTPARSERSADRRSWSVNLGIYVSEDSPLARLSVISGRPVQQYAAVSEQVGLAKQWLQDCLRSHGSSCLVSGPKQLPTRVIDVRGIPFLVLTGSQSGSWVALSHCWGREVKFVTTKNNLESMRQGIRMESLPATFRDAVIATREMGFDYLWIDSLCIVQDSDEDWLYEAGKMQDYYKHSTLTIAVDSTIGDHEGFLETPRSGDEFCTRIPLRTSLTNQSCHANIRYNVDLMGLNLETTHLSKRAWTLQEDLLSPRSLHFTAEYLAWECQGHRVTEADRSPVGVTEGELVNITKRFFLHPQAAEGDPVLMKWPYMREHFRPLVRWYNILDKYCQRRLTFGKDRLIAIDGMAKEIQLQTGFTYLSGLWKEDMLFGFLWQLDARGSCPDTRRAPSWSWAGLDIEWDWGQTVNPMLQLNYATRQAELSQGGSGCAEILTTCPDPADGQCSVTLRGLMLPLAAWDSSTKPYFRAYWRRPVSHTGALQWEKAGSNDMLICSFDEDPYPLSGSDTSSVTSDSQLLNDEAEKNVGADPSSAEEDEHSWEEEAMRDVWMLQIIGARSSRGFDLCFALLLRAQDGEPDHFLRVGIAEVPVIENLHPTDWSIKEITLV